VFCDYDPLMLTVAIAFDQPLFWAVLVGWIMSVTLHEFAHGLVAHLGGDYTIKERGGLTLNPLQYIDPVGSLLLPAVFLMIGGIPLPGGVTYVRLDLLRSKAWETAVSLAGPLMNFLIFLVLAAVLHPRVGWIDPSLMVNQWTNAQIFCGAMAFLQLFAVVLNLFPVPPLDGFGAIAPYLKDETRFKLSTPPTSTFLMIGFFVLIFAVPAVREFIFNRLMSPIFNVVGLDTYTLWAALRVALTGTAG